LLAADLYGLDMVALMVDGVHLGEHTCIDPYRPRPGHGPLLPGIPGSGCQVVSLDLVDLSPVTLGGLAPGRPGEQAAATSDPDLSAEDVALGYKT